MYSDNPDGDILWFKASIPPKAIDISAKLFQVKTEKKGIYCVYVPGIPLVTKDKAVIETDTSPVYGKFTHERRLSLHFLHLISNKVGGEDDDRN